MTIHTCQVDGCKDKLTNCKPYCARYRVCSQHLTALCENVGGVPSRFCQQCAKFHAIGEFDGTKRSCRLQLARHNDARNQRRREKALQRYSSTDSPASHAAQQQQNRSGSSNSSDISVAADQHQPLAIRGHAHASEGQPEAHPHIYTALGHSNTDHIDNLEAALAAALAAEEAEEEEAVAQHLQQQQEWQQQQQQQQDCSDVGGLGTSSPEAAAAAAASGLQATVLYSRQQTRKFPMPVRQQQQQQQQHQHHEEQAALPLPPQHQPFYSGTPFSPDGSYDSTAAAAAQHHSTTAAANGPAQGCCMPGANCPISSASMATSWQQQQQQQQYGVNQRSQDQSIYMRRQDDTRFLLEPPGCRTAVGAWEYLRPGAVGGVQDIYNSSSSSGSSMSTGHGRYHATAAPAAAAAAGLHEYPSGLDRLAVPALHEQSSRGSFRELLAGRHTQRRQQQQVQLVVGRTSGSSQPLIWSTTVRTTATYELPPNEQLPAWLRHQLHRTRSWPSNSIQFVNDNCGIAQDVQHAQSTPMALHICDTSLAPFAVTSPIQLAPHDPLWRQQQQQQQQQHWHHSHRQQQQQQHNGMGSDTLQHPTNAAAEVQQQQQNTGEAASGVQCSERVVAELYRQWNAGLR